MLDKHLLGFNLDPNYTKDMWEDGQWQTRNIMTSFSAIKKAVPQEYHTKIDNYINNAVSSGNNIKHFALSITPYYLSLIDFDNLDTCPIAIQSFMTNKEDIVSSVESGDPLNEAAQSHSIKSLVHRYPDRCLFLVANTCSMYCRFCTRKRIVGNKDEHITSDLIEAGLEYIRNTPVIRDVLLSGGDPLFMGVKRLKYIIGKLKEIPHVEFIRIGTRIPCVLPQRVTDELIEVLSEHAPIWINVHFNHPKELTDDTKKALMKLLKAGCPLNNQSVLLRGVNDDIDTFKKLNQKLLTQGVRPYYIYQCDLAEGMSHLRVPIQKGIELIEGMIGYTTGLARPTFILDSPMGTGKIPIMPNFVKEIGEKETDIVVRDYLGNTIKYTS